MIWRAAILFVAGFVLASCSGEDKSRIACPDVEVLRDLSEVTRFNPGQGRDPTDVLLEAWVERVNGTCLLDDENLLVDLTVQILTRRGPANRTEGAEIPYFVAITDPRGNVLNRESFKTNVSYISRKSISFEDVLTLSIPLAAGTETDSFVIYVGLELSEDELRYNRSRVKR